MGKCLCLYFIYFSCIDREMDDIYSNIRNEIEDLAEYTGEVVRARKINKNFKDESARIRVHHNTNIIAANMYEAANIDLQVIYMFEIRVQVCVCDTFLDIFH